MWMIPFSFFGIWVESLGSKNIGVLREMERRKKNQLRPSG